MDIQQLFKLADNYHQRCLEKLIKIAVIKKLPSGKWQVQSEKGKNLGTYDTKEKAVTRLRQVEYFKHHDKNDVNNSKVIDLIKADEFSFSAIMRCLHQQVNKEQAHQFLKLFKTHFDEAVKNKTSKPEKYALRNALIDFDKLHRLKINKKLIKSATLVELGTPAQIGQYLANIVKFNLSKLNSEQRSKAINNLRNKFYAMNANELAQKDMPPTSSIGQSITFVKHVLFGQSPDFIRQVLNNVAGNLS